MMIGLLFTPHNSFVSDKTSERLFNVIKKNLTILMKNGENK